MEHNKWMWVYKGNAYGWFDSHQAAYADAKKALHPSRVPDVALAKFVHT